MNRIIVCIAAALLSLSVYGQKVDSLRFVDAKDLMIINKGFDNTEYDYSRLPLDMKGVIRQAVWDLGLNSAGVAVRFSSDSKCIGARWTLLNNFGMSHMAATGVKGIDLYTLDNGTWKFIGTAKPNGKESANVFVRNMVGEMREYLAYMPLYDGATKVEIGVDSSSVIGLPINDVLVKSDKKPIVFYGTSITQGGCASRPGMTYAAIMGRKLQQETINLGFSGNARMDKSMAEVVARIDADKYVIDCIPNCTVQILRDSAYYFITYLAKARPETPIYLVENVIFPYSLVDTKTAVDLKEENAYWAELYDRLCKEGYTNLKYIPAKDLIGDDGECTVDGCHMTDLGFMRMAESFLKQL
ncbi:MAG: SGNH/GDSL hydrolase family protein [Bacteroidales bacterium]|nr:SGNH/GDSL hydrolase family protein [Bacteroidales bacterium]MDD4670086.1 SGNH/GDSL hydrolase family protein [Bacteroidales bacterium]